MFCYKCGCQLEPDTKFCPKCGAMQEENENNSVPNAPSLSSQQDIPKINLNKNQDLSPEQQNVPVQNFNIPVNLPVENNSMPQTPFENQNEQKIISGAELYKQQFPNEPINIPIVKQSNTPKINNKIPNGKKGFPKILIPIISASLVVIILAVIFIPKIFSNGEQHIFLYTSANEVYVFNPENQKSYSVSSHSYSCSNASVSKDFKYIYYLSSSNDLYKKDLSEVYSGTDKGLSEEKLVSNVSSYAVSDSGNQIYYLKGDTLYSYNSDGGNKVESNISDINYCKSNNTMIYCVSSSSSSKSIKFLNSNGEATKLESDIYDIYKIENDNSAVYYVKKHGDNYELTRYTVSSQAKDIMCKFDSSFTSSVKIAAIQENKIFFTMNQGDSTCTLYSYDCSSGAKKEVSQGIKNAYATVSNSDELSYHSSLYMGYDFSDIDIPSVVSIYNSASSYSSYSSSSSTESSTESSYSDYNYNTESSYSDYDDNTESSYSDYDDNTESSSDDDDLIGLSTQNSNSAKLQTVSDSSDSKSKYTYYIIKDGVAYILNDCDTSYSSAGYDIFNGTIYFSNSKNNNSLAYAELNAEKQTFEIKDTAVENIKSVETTSDNKLFYVSSEDSSYDLYMADSKESIIKSTKSKSIGSDIKYYFAVNQNEVYYIDDENDLYYYNNGKPIMVESSVSSGILLSNNNKISLASVL